VDKAAIVLRKYSDSLDYTPFSQHAFVCQHQAIQSTFLYSKMSTKCIPVLVDTHREPAIKHR